MEVLYAIFLTVFCVISVPLAIWAIIHALRYGHLEFIDNEFACERRKKPVQFWLMIVLMLLGIIYLISGWLNDAWPILEKLIF